MILNYLNKKKIKNTVLRIRIVQLVKNLLLKLSIKLIYSFFSFRLYDINQDGYIDIQEMSKIIKVSDLKSSKKF